MHAEHRITQHIRYRLTVLPFEILLPSVATSYMPKLLAKNSPTENKGGQTQK